MNDKAHQQANSFRPLSGAHLGDPVEIPGSDVNDLAAPGNSRLDLGGIWGSVRRGETWTASTGKRFIISATSTDVIFYERGRFFYQKAAGFRGDVTTWPWIQAAQQAEPFVRVAEMEMELILGIIAGASGVGFALVVGSEVLHFLLVHSTDFTRWRSQLALVMQAREKLKTVAPTVYDKLFDACLTKAMRDVKRDLPDAATPEVISFMVGVILGHLGAHATKGPLTALTVIWTVLNALVRRFVLSVVPGAFKLAAKDYEETARQVIEQFKSSGLSITPADVDKMIDEIRKHPGEVKEAYRLLEQAFKDFEAKNSKK